MLKFALNILFKTIDGIAYVVFLCIGIHLIHYGNVVEKFLSKRTTFAEYDEQMTEYPTMQTWSNKLLEHGWKWTQSCNLGVYG